MNYDVIIAGGGFSGVACARRLSLAGLRVLLLDPRPPEQFGAPYSSVMLDVDTFSKTGLERPQGEELLHLLDQFYAYSPSGRVKKPIDFSALLVNGQRLLQRLLAEAQAAGLAVQQDAATALNFGDGRVCGLRNGAGADLSARLVIDATGTARSLSEQLASGGLSLAAHPQTLAIGYGMAYRRLCHNQTADNELHIHFAFEGGYVWRSPNDTGLGLTRWIEPDQARELLDQAIERFDWQVGEIQAEAFGRVPVRYPLPGMVAPGFAVVGDAACMVNSVRGGGISAGLKGAHILADVAEAALAAGDLSTAGLWDYNLRYQREVGAQLAYQDAMRLTIMNESSDNMEFAFERDLVSADDIRASLSGRLLDFSPMQKLQKGLRGAANPGLLMRLNHKLEAASRLYRHFKEFPAAPGGFEPWEQELHAIQESFT
jgi:flavin-dependent dehydrogenase